MVERKLAFPEQPLPDPKMLRMDFDTCVRTGNKEILIQLGGYRTQ